MRIQRLVKSILWLIQVRWLAVVFVLGSTLISKHVLHISIYERGIYWVTLALLVSNLVFYFLIKYFLHSGISNTSNYFRILLNVQILVDFIILTLLLHFSGSIENPFIIVYIFHMILAGILLPVKESFLQTSFALLLIAILVFLEYFQVFPHYPLIGLVKHELYSNFKYLFWTGIIFIVVSYLVVYMVSYVTRQLKKYEEAYRLANIQLEEKDKIKNEYVLKLTHDIKGHLSAILSCLDVVKSKIPGNLNEKQNEFIARAYTRTNYLAGFVKDLLKHTKMQLQQKLEMEYFSLLESLDKILPPLENRANEKQIKLSYNIDKKIDKIYGNQLLIEEILQNLLINAVSYTPEKGKVWLKISDLKYQIIFEIIDTGIGISQHDLKKIFNEFFRGSDAKKMAPEGTGIGLAMVKHMAKQHEGDITCESNVGNGSTFIFKMPKQKQNKTDLKPV